jgi:hypothetical protein
MICRPMSRSEACCSALTGTGRGKGWRASSSGCAGTALSGGRFGMTLLPCYAVSVPGLIARMLPGGIGILFAVPGPGRSGGEEVD